MASQDQGLGVLAETEPGKLAMWARQGSRKPGSISLHVYPRYSQTQRNFQYSTPFKHTALTESQEQIFILKIRSPKH